MKYKALKGVSWGGYSLYGVEKAPVVVDAATLKTPDGKPLPQAVIDLFVAQGCWVPHDDDTVEVVTQ